MTQKTLRGMRTNIKHDFSTNVVGQKTGGKEMIAFLNWLGSSDVQLDWSNNYGTIPCQKEALDQVSDDIKELMETLKPQDLDWSFIAENVDAWVEKAELEYVQ